jgi:F0F1-type ATP synthase membrane subunit c/vacuolar-type H+-ATPase subunit K
MRSKLKLAVGAYGLVFHAVVAAALVGIAAKNRAPIPTLFWTITIPALLFAAFVIYALAVSPYVARRVQRRGAVFYDALVGMAAEPAIVALTALVYGLVGASAAGGGLRVFANELAARAQLAMLWSFANFMTQILVIGNAAGFVGFVVLKRLAQRRAA